MPIIEIVEPLKRDFSPIVFASREEALEYSKESGCPYVIYFDESEKGYPFIKFVCCSNQEGKYLALDEMFDQLQLEFKQCIAIHDTYSAYPTNNYQTYALPLTHGNMEILRVLLPDSAFPRIDDFFNEFSRNMLTTLTEEVVHLRGMHLQSRALLKQRVQARKNNDDDRVAQIITEMDEIVTQLNNRLMRHHTLMQFWDPRRSASIKSMANYANVDSKDTDDPYEKLDKTTLESEQKEIACDKMALFFIRDDCQFVFNDILIQSQPSPLDAVLPEGSTFVQIADSYNQRRSDAPERRQKERQILEKKIAAAERIVDEKTIRLFAVLCSDELKTIFSPFSVKYAQCKNEAYNGLLNTQVLQSKLKSDADFPFRENCSIPRQDQMMQMMDCGHAWMPHPPGSDFNSYQRTTFSPHHRGWQCGLAYIPFDEQEQQLMHDLGYQFDLSHVNRLLSIPYDYYKLFVLLHSINETKVHDVKLQMLRDATAYVDRKLETGAIETIPVQLILAIEEVHPDTAQRYRETNQAYYDRVVLPALRQESLSIVKNVFFSSRFSFMTAVIFNSEHGSFEEVHIPGNDEVLREAILTLEDGRDFDMEWIKEHTEQSSHNFNFRR